MFPQSKIQGATKLANFEKFIAPCIFGNTSNFFRYFGKSTFYSWFVKKKQSKTEKYYM